MERVDSQHSCFDADSRQLVKYVARKIPFKLQNEV